VLAGTALHRRTPIAYVDDHDYGPDDAARSSTREAARRYYGVDVPHYPLPLAPLDEPSRGLRRAGCFLMTDVPERRPPAMLGRGSRRLLAELEQAAATARRSSRG
jgi:hypothetical protein